MFDHKNGPTTLSVFGVCAEDTTHKIPAYYPDVPFAWVQFAMIDNHIYEPDRARMIDLLGTHGKLRPDLPPTFKTCALMCRLLRIHRIVRHAVVDAMDGEPQQLVFLVELHDKQGLETVCDVGPGF